MRFAVLGSGSSGNAVVVRAGNTLVLVDAGFSGRDLERRLGLLGVAPPEIHTKDIWQSVPPFVAIQLLVLLLTMLFPQLALWLPGKML